MTVTVRTSRLWKKLLPARSQSKPQPPPAAKCASGWDRLPPELVDDILGYLSDDLPTLKACSLTCRAMLCSARPLIRNWLFLASTQNRRSSARSLKSILKRSKTRCDLSERLSSTDRQGLLRYTQHLVIRMGCLPHTPRPLQPYVSYLRSIDNLRTLTVDALDIPAFMPTFDKCFGMFAKSLRSLDIGHTWDSESHLLWFISKFPSLEDLSIRSRYTVRSYPGTPLPMPQTSPYFRGHLKLTHVMGSQDLCEALAKLPGGLNFTSLELKGCEEPAAIITACRLTLRSVSYTWTSSMGKFRFLPKYPCLQLLPVAGHALDLRDGSVLEKLEFQIDRANISSTPGWLYRTLWRINSRAFKELIISISNCSSAADLHAAMDGGGWRSVDGYLCVLARLQPNFKVVFRVEFEDCAAGSMIEEYFSLASGRGVVEIEYVPVLLSESVGGPHL